MVKFAFSFAAASLLTAAAFATAQEYPSKTMRIVTSEGGGAANLAARLIAEALSARHTALHSSGVAFWSTPMRFTDATREHEEEAQ